MLKCSADIPLLIKLWNIEKNRFIHALNIKRMEMTLYS